MSLADTIRRTVTSPGYLLQLNNSYYSSRGPKSLLSQQWLPLCFEISGLSTDGGASSSLTIAITDSDRAWTDFIDNHGLDDLKIDVWKMYEDQESDALIKVFSGEASSAISDSNIVKINALGVRYDYSITPRNRWISDFSNVSAGSAVVINGETVRFLL